jgi:hypothetical protein
MSGTCQRHALQRTDISWWATGLIMTAILIRARSVVQVHQAHHQNQVRALWRPTWLSMPQVAAPTLPVGLRLSDIGSSKRKALKQDSLRHLPLRPSPRPFKWCFTRLDSRNSDQQTRWGYRSPRRQPLGCDVNCEKRRNGADKSQRVH